MVIVFILLEVLSISTLVLAFALFERRRKYTTVGDLVVGGFVVLCQNFFMVLTAYYLLMK